jgi:hypothetical protein
MLSLTLKCYSLNSFLISAISLWIWSHFCPGIYDGYLQYYTEVTRSPEKVKCCSQMEHFVALCMYNNMAVAASLLQPMSSPHLRNYHEKILEIVNLPFHIVNQAPGRYRKAILGNLSIWEEIYSPPSSCNPLFVTSKNQ